MGRHYLFGVGRYVASARAVDGAAMNAAASRFLVGLARSAEPQHVRHAEEAIKLYSFFQTRTRTEVALPPDGTADLEWDALAEEMTRIARLKRRALRAERSYLGWYQIPGLHAGNAAGEVASARR